MATSATKATKRIVKHLRPLIVPSISFMGFSSEQLPRSCGRALFSNINGRTLLVNSLRLNDHPRCPRKTLERDRETNSSAVHRLRVEECLNIDGLPRG